MLLEKFGGRKFLLTLITLAVGTAVQILSPHGVTESFVALLVGISAAYGATNAAVTWKALGKETAEVEASTKAELAEGYALAAAPEPVDLSPIYTQIEQLAGVVNSHNAAITGLQENAVNTQKLVKAALSVRS